MKGPKKRWGYKYAKKDKLQTANYNRFCYHKSKAIVSIDFILIL